MHRHDRQGGSGVRGTERGEREGARPETRPDDGQSTQGARLVDWFVARAPMLLRWAPLGVIVACGALLAFRLGWIDAHLTETAAIEAYGARYMRDAGAPAADCTGVPGERVWLEVRCGPVGAAWVYRVKRFGGLVEVIAPGGADAAREEARA